MLLHILYSFLAAIAIVSGATAVFLCLGVLIDYLSDRELDWVVPFIAAVGSITALVYLATYVP